jgi:hypothetical protein
MGLLDLRDRRVHLVRQDLQVRRGRLGVHEVGVCSARGVVGRQLGLQVLLKETS